MRRPDLRRDSRRAREERMDSMDATKVARRVEKMDAGVMMTVGVTTRTGEVGGGPHHLRTGTMRRNTRVHQLADLLGSLEIGNALSRNMPTSSPGRTRLFHPLRPCSAGTARNMAATLATIGATAHARQSTTQ